MFINSFSFVPFHFVVEKSDNQRTLKTSSSTSSKDICTYIDLFNWGVCDLKRFFFPCLKQIFKFKLNEIEKEKDKKMPPQKWSTNTTSTKYITDEMLAPFVSSLLPTSQIELTLSCRNLINTDIISKSDPYCVISMKEPWQDQYYEIARTETIDDCLSPQWVKKVILNYNFETIQKIRFEVRDEDMQGYDFLGSYETTLSELVSYSGRQFIGKLKGMSVQNCGDIIIVTEEVSTCKQIARIKFSAEQLPKLGWVYSNDPFLVISR